MVDTALHITERKEDRILEAAVRVFAERGYHGGSMATVAQEAGVAAGTIYLYFERKQDLLITLFRRDLGDYIERCRPALAEAPAGVPRLRLLVGHHLAFFEEDRARASVFQIHAREPDPILSEGIRPVVAEYFDIIGDVLSEGVRTGAFAADLDVRLARHVFFGALDDVVTGWLKASRPYSLLRSLEPLAAMLARAFGAPVTGDPS
jgi:TetR/AcrR family fatty acid metabolism transcriptional regulator